MCVSVRPLSKAACAWCGDQCNQSGLEMEGAVSPELDVKSFGQNVFCSEFIMCCLKPTDECCSGCVCVCVFVCLQYV